MRFEHAILAAALLTGVPPAGWADVVGPAPGGVHLLPTGQRIRPVGRSLAFHGRPVDLALAADGRTLFAKSDTGLLVVDRRNWKLRQEYPFPQGGGSMHGLAVTRRRPWRVYATTAQNLVWEAIAGADGSLKWARKLLVPGPAGRGASYPCGIALSPDEKTAYICLSRNNTLGVLDLATGRLKTQIRVGVAPYDVALDLSGGVAYVSNWGGRHPRSGERTALSSGTPTLVDARGVAASGTVSVVDLTSRRERTQIKTGLQPSDLALDRTGRTLYVAAANSDTVSIIDTARRRVVATVRADPSSPSLLGAAPNALALSPDTTRLYVANGRANTVASFTLRGRGRRTARLEGVIPTAWYPGALVADDRWLYVANVKGLGSRFRRPKAKGWNSYAHLGTLTRVAIPSRSAAISPPVEPTRTGGSRTSAAVLPRFEHVVYIIKENRTYDQVFGDLPQGNGDLGLCIFGRSVTPNHHALAEQFVLLDNFYCNGVNSADGHAWATEGNVTPYLEKSFGGFTRSYTWGDDPLSYSSSGFIWDNVLDHGRTFRNYGEMDYAEPVPPKATFSEIYGDFTSGERRIRFTQNIGIDRLRAYTCPEYPGWNMRIPDVLRAEVFLRELQAHEAKGSWPNFVIVFLPSDHTSGTAPGAPTPRAQVADNDLALGQVVEGITRSRFWPKTCIFVIEDDPQDGFDHVDGHRSLCLVISPYTRRGAVVSDFYNQTSVLHTMERMLGLPPMNRMDATSPLMTRCFTSRPDLTPYRCLPNQIPLDEMNPGTANLQGKALYWAHESQRLPLERPDQADEETLNRILWHSVKGVEAPYPEEFEGAHGKGLRALGLDLSPPPAEGAAGED
jgi:YVTN family beta-propeller protein